MVEDRNLDLRSGSQIPLLWTLRLKGCAVGKCAGGRISSVVALTAYKDTSDCSIREEDLCPTTYGSIFALETHSQ